MAGVLVAAVGIGPAFVLDAASFGLAALALLAMQGGRRPPRPVSPDAMLTAEPSILASIREGAAYALRDPGIRSIILLSAAVNLATSGPIAVGLAWLANVRFDGGPALLGVMFAGFGGGAVIGAIVAGSTPRPRRFGLVVLGLAALLGVLIAALGLAANGALATTALVGSGVAAGYLNVTIISWSTLRRACPARAGDEPRDARRRRSAADLAGRGRCPGGCPRDRDVPARRCPHPRRRRDCARRRGLSIPRLRKERTP